MRSRQDLTSATSLLLALSCLLPIGCSGGGGGNGGGIDTTVLTFTIGAAGGTATSADGGAVLVIPPGALASAQTISVGRVNLSEASSALAASDPSVIYEFGPDGLEFSTPASLTLGLEEPQGDVPGTITLDFPLLISETASGIEGLDEVTISVEPGQRCISAPVSHFSRFSLGRATTSSGRIRVDHPTSLGEGQEGIIEMTSEFPDNPNLEWSISAPEMTLDLVGADFDSSIPNTQAFVACASAELPSVSVGYFTTIELFGLSRSYTTTVSFTIQCPPPPAGVQAPLLIDVFMETGQTGPEALNVADGPCGETLGVWVATEQGGVLLAPLDPNPVKTMLSGFAPVFDILNLNNPSGTQSALQFSGASQSFVSPTDETICDWNLGAFSLPNFSDVSRRGNGSIGADALFARLVVTNLEGASGSPDFIDINISNNAKTATGNAAGDALLFVSASSDELVHVSVDGTLVTETDVVQLGDDVRRMRWDAESGFGAISDFNGNSLTLFRWAGDDTLPLVFGTESVGAGPVGVDVHGTRVVCAGFNDDTYTEILIDPAGPSVLSSETLPIPFVNPMGAGQPLQPGHAFFLRDATDTIVFSLFGADAVAFLPTLP